MSDDKPGSLRDYFGDESPSGLPEDLSIGSPHSDGNGEDELLDDFEQRRQYETRRMSAIRQSVMSASFLAVVVWFLVGHRDWIAYSLKPVQQPVAVGSAVGISREQLQHNSYVAIEGVTLHRGMVQKIIRGVGFSRQELHYFELTGSKGVFIEVLPERGIGFANEVSLQGRVVDPKRDEVYSKLLETYENLYLQKRRPAERIIQVGIKPGVQRAAVVGASVGLLLLFWLNVWALLRVFRSVKRRA